MFSNSNTPQSPSRGATPSIICVDVVIVGSLHGDGDIQIDGRVEGNIRAATLMIGESSRIDGEIQAECVTVRGTVNGSIRAQEVMLAASSHIEGDVWHTKLEVESGAVINGSFHHTTSPSDEKPVQQSEDAAPKERRRSNSPMRAVENITGTEQRPAARTGTTG